VYIKVAGYIRNSGTREYEKASPRVNYPTGTTFCLRYTQQGKRKFATLSVPDYKQANIAAARGATPTARDWREFQTEAKRCTLLGS
jgi:hypothetical protein